jgi:hypothetical protein
MSTNTDAALIHRTADDSLLDSQVFADDTEALLISYTAININMLRDAGDDQEKRARLWRRIAGVALRQAAKLSVAR